MVTGDIYLKRASMLLADFGQVEDDIFKKRKERRKSNKKRRDDQTEHRMVRKAAKAAPALAATIFEWCERAE